MSIIKHKYVPVYKSICEADLNKINDFIKNTKNLFIVSGAGLSTESGIPDYRSEGVGLYSRTDHKPMQFSDFVKSADRRQMYWARNYVSWPIFSSFKPNPAHKTLVDWEKKGKIFHHVTQNVDGLLKKSGSIRLTELHGTSYKVMCMNCDFKLTRDSMQTLLKAHNPNWNEKSDELAPDNDVKLSDEQCKKFKNPDCPQCSKALLKPDIVFFGDSIKKTVVENLNKNLEQCDGLLAIGTTVQVYSSYRILLRARDLGIPIAIVNIGETRGDKLADFKISTKCSDVIQQIKF